MSVRGNSRVCACLYSTGPLFAFSGCSFQLSILLMLFSFLTECSSFTFERSACPYGDAQHRTRPARAIAYHPDDTFPRSALGNIMPRSICVCDHAWAGPQVCVARSTPSQFRSLPFAAGCENIAAILSLPDVLVRPLSLLAWLSLRADQ